VAAESQKCKSFIIIIIIEIVKQLVVIKKDKTSDREAQQLRWWRAGSSSLPAEQGC